MKNNFNFFFLFLIIFNAKGVTTITSFSPLTGIPGSSVTITGIDFNTTAANNIVYFGAVKAIVTNATSTSLTVTVPSGATYAPITVLNTSLSSIPSIAISDKRFTPISSVSISLGSNSFDSILISSSAGNLNYSTMGDLDGDGKPELVFSHGTSTSIIFFPNNSSNNSFLFGSPTILNVESSFSPKQISLGDLDRDGKLDIAVSIYNSNTGVSKLSVFRNTSSGIGNFSYATISPIIIGYPCYSQVISDINNDGKLDIIATCNGGPLNIFQNTSTGVGNISFSSSTSMFSSGNSNSQSPKIVDLDGDNLPDIITNGVQSSGGGLLVYKNNSSGSTISFTLQYFESTSGPQDIAVGDIDGDGKPDVAFNNYGGTTFSVVRNTSTSGTISFASKIDFITPVNNWGMNLGDLTGDGKLDLVICNITTDVLVVYTNTSTSGTINFSSGNNFAVGTNSYYPQICDLDLNGVPEIFCGSSAQSLITILKVIIPTEWTGATDRNWGTATNWSMGLVPNSSNNVTIPSSASNQPIIGSAAVCRNLTITSGATLDVNSGSLIVDSLTNNGTLTSSGTITTNTNLTNTGSLLLSTGTLNINSTINNTGTFNVSSGNVNYTGAAQTALVSTYNNLTLSGSGAKTFVTTPTVNGILSMEGTASVVVTGTGVVTYGTAATLQYNKAASYTTTSEEWITPFVASGGIVIKNTGAITLNRAVQIGDNTNVPLNINGGATLTPGANLMTLHGDFINAGILTSGSGGITLAGTTATQSIAGFTTTGTVGMTKTTGIATFIGNVTGATLTINGSGGTLSLGSALNHTFTNWIRTNGTLEGGSSTFNLSGSVTGSSVTFNESASTFNYSGVAQNCLSTTYNNLTLSGSGAKTFTNPPTVKGVLSLEGSASIAVTNGEVTYGSAATLQYNKGTNTHTASDEWVTPFTASGGIVIKGTGVITLNAAKIMNTLTLVTGAKMSLGSFTNSKTDKLLLGGSNMAIGTYGGTGSGATYINTTYFSAVAGKLSVEHVPYWTGVTSSSWKDSSNWSDNKLPLSTDYVVIPATNNQPIIDSNISCSNIEVLTGATLSISGTNALTISTNLINKGTISLGSGTLNIQSAFSNTGTFTAGTSTVNYSGAAQTAAAVTYNNLTLSGSGIKTFATTPTVNGILSLEGTATVVVTGTGVVTYGTAATLQYNKPAAYTATLEEWPATFSGTGGVIIANTGIITLDVAKVFGNSTNVPLNINSNATLATVNLGLTFHGDFINNGTLTAGSSAITITGTNATQNISGFTTTGTVSMTKTGGTATFTGNITGGTLTINGSGGTLNLGSALTHTFSVWTRTNGTLNGESSTLNLSGSSSGTGGTYNAGTSTVIYSGAAQTAAVVTYNNLTLSGSGIKTFATTPTVNGILSLEGTATVVVTGTGVVTYGTAATLQYNKPAAYTATLEEWPATFSGTGGVIIANTGIITLDVAKVFGNSTNVPLNINSTATLATVNLGLTFHGDFINNGTLTAGSSPIIITGTNATQNISGFTTTGSVSMTKTGGTATLTGNVSASDLTLNGLGGTLNLGSGLTHTFTNWTRTTGTLDGGSSTLNLSGSLSGSSGTFTAGTSTVIYSGSAQTAAAVTYNNLTLSGSGVKTMTGVTTIGGNFNMSGSATATTVITSIGGNVSISGTAVWTNGAINTTTGTLTVGTGATFTMSNFAYINTGASSISGTVNTATGNTGTKTFTGAVTINAGGVWDLTGQNPATSFAGGINMNGTTFNNGTGAAAFSASQALAGTGAMTFGASVTPASGITLTNNNSGTVTINNLVLTGNFTQGSNTPTLSLVNAAPLSGAGTFNASTNANTVNYIGASQPILAVNYSNLTINGTGTATMGSATTVSGTMTVTTAATNNSTLTVTTALTGIGTLTQGTNAILNIGGTLGITGLTATASGNTVNYTGDAQTAAAVTYNNLTLSGSGTKTFTNTPTVNGILSLEGTAPIDVTGGSGAVTYGAAATLQYNKGSNNYTATTEEWISPFVATGGIIIKGTGAITTPGVVQIGDNSNVPLTIESGATLTPGANLMTLHGDFINAGTLTSGSGGITLAGTTATQNIAGFTTTGTLSMTKTSGTATFTGNVTGGTLTINGSGGTLNLGSGLTHTFTNWNSTSGILNAGSSTLNFSVSVTGTGATFTAGTSTVNYTGVAQTAAAVTYNNLTLSGSGTKTFTNTPTVNGTLSLEGTASIDVTGGSGAVTYGAAATLQYNKGSNNYTATTEEWISPFVATGGIIIKGTGAITTPGVVQIGDNSNVPLTIESGATLTPGANLMTLHGDFINAGTLTSGSGGITLAGTTATQSIASYTTTGTVSMTKTAGIATFTGNVTGGPLTINGSGGTLNLGSGLTHTFTNWNSTSGILNAGSSTLNFSGSVTGTGATFTAGTSTVNYTGDAQTAAVVTYNNLTLSGSGIKTFATTPTVNGILSMEGTASIPSTVVVTYGSAATLQYNKSASYTATSAEWISPFVATGGIIIKGTGAIKVNAAKIINELAIETGAKINLDTITNLKTNKLILGSTTMSNGTYGGTGSSATNINTTYFSNATGVLNVARIPYWTGINSTSWTTATNWSDNTLPISTDYVVIPATNNQPIIGSSISCSNLEILSGATLSISGSNALTISAELINKGTITFVSGTLNIQGAFSNTGTFTAGTSTVNYSGGAQNAAVVTYNNLTLSGSGIKTFDNTPTVNGILSLEGTASVIVTTGVITYGVAATLQYNKGLNTYTATTEEWISPFVATGGIIIKGTGAITTPGVVQIGNNSNVPLTINSGATLTPGANLITLHGNFIKSGTLTSGAGGITIGGTLASQSIAGFTTSGKVRMTKTSGTATFTSNVTGVDFESVGAGTLSLGTNLIHTFTNWIKTDGTLDGGSSTFNLSGAVTGTGVSFLESSSTFNYSGSAQNIWGTTYNNLTLSGSGVKTLINSPIVNGILSLEGTATIAKQSIGDSVTYGSAATLQYNKGTNPYTVTSTEWITPFKATGGIIIKGSGAGVITLNRSVQIGDNTNVPLTINSSATLTPGANLITLHGNFINSGTLTSGTGGITIGGTVANQSIEGFTTTGALRMTKTSGTATIAKSIMAAGVFVSGNGGTLNLGSAFTFLYSTAAIAISSGATLNAVNSDIEIMGTGNAFTIDGTFIPGTGEVKYSGATANVAATTYYDLEISIAGNKTLLGATTVNNILRISNSAKLNLAGQTLTLGGSFSGTNSTSLIGSATSSIITSGTTGNLFFDQTTPGTTNVLKNLTVNAGSVSLGNALNITAGSSFGVVTVSSGATLTTGGFLTLKSDANGTASIGTSTGTISGNVTVERYIPANGRKYRFLSSPVVGGSTLQWRDNAGTTSGRGIQITGPTGTVDASISNAKSAFYYDETLTGGTINDFTKWINIDGNTSLTNGKGYRVFVRGDRTINLTTLNTTNNATTIWVNGSYPSNPVTLPITYTAGGADGWNLVGNPYPCTIDWDLVKVSGTSNFSNVSDAIYIQHPLNANYSSGGYTSYIGGIGSGTPNVGTRYISSSQGFMVKATGSSPILKIAESNKVSAQQGGKIFKTTDEPSHLRLKLFADTIQFDDAVIHFTEGATKNFDNKYDAYDLTGGIGLLTADLKDTLAINGFPKLQVNDAAKICMNVQKTGTYKIMFADMSTFDNKFQAYFVDHFLNKNTLINEGGIYSFNIDTNNLFTYGNTRFEIVFVESNTSHENILNRKNQTQLSVYPNPATDVLNINISNASFKNSRVTISNISGQELMNTNMIGTNTQVNIEGLSNGIYFVNITNDNGFNKTVKFVK